MEPKIISSQIIVKPQEKMPNIIVGTANNFKRTAEPGDNYRRPLMVNAWSQTTGGDFSFLHELENKQEQSKREKELLEKVRVLEENLKAHTELLSQIHATSARTSALLGQQQLPPLPVIKPIQIQTVESQSSAYQINQNTTTQISPLKNHNSPTSSVINPLHTMASTPTESVKYTIIAEGSGDVHGEPIEIQLAEDDGALNLNSSADSGRLEICLAPEDVEIKTESLPTPTGVLSHNNSTASMGSSEQSFIKRRKLGVYQNESISENSNYYFNDQGVLTPSNGNANNNNFTHQQQPIAPAPKRRSNNSLLKTTKRDHNSSSHIHTTPIHSLMPSPTNSSSGIGMEKKIDTDYVMVSIGPNNTRIPAKVYEGMIWNSASIATRKLLMAIFDRKTLATHSMTGKPSPAFKDHGKPLKQMLDPLVIQDIIFAVTRKCNVSEKEVRNAITTKCADENKMMKLQMNKRTPMREINKENIAAGINTLKSEV